MLHAFLAVPGESLLATWEAVTAAVVRAGYVPKTELRMKLLLTAQQTWRFLAPQ